MSPTPPDLPPSALYIYDVLEEIGPATQQELQQRTSLPQSTVSYALRRLQSSELIDVKPTTPRVYRRGVG